jgi:hypothetical protein
MWSKVSNSNLVQRSIHFIRTFCKPEYFLCKHAYYSVPVITGLFLTYYTISSLSDALPWHRGEARFAHTYMGNKRRERERRTTLNLYPSL